MQKLILFTAFFWIIPSYAANKKENQIHQYFGENSWRYKSTHNSINRCLQSYEGIPNTLLSLKKIKINEDLLRKKQNSVVIYQKKLAKKTTKDGELIQHIQRLSKLFLDLSSQYTLFLNCSRQETNKTIQEARQILYNQTRRGKEILYVFCPECKSIKTQPKPAAIHIAD